MTERKSDREIILTSSQVLVILLLFVILLIIVFVLGISMGRKQKALSAHKTEELPPVIIKEREPEEEIPKIEGRTETGTKESITVSRFFFIQVGAFTSESSANSLAEKFRERNYPVKVIPPSPQDKPSFFRVRVGPYLKIEDAKEVLGKLKQTGKENYFIVSEEGR